MDNRRTYIVTEMCPNCEREVEIHGWNTEVDGFEATCPYCGGRLMLCDECQHNGNTVSCDWCRETDSCRMRMPRKLWMRLGVSLEVNRAEEKLLIEGDKDTLIRLVKQQRFSLDGDSYIPDVAVERYNDKYGTYYSVEDVNFEI